MQSKDTLYVLKGQFTSKVHVFLKLVVLFIQLHLLNTQKSKSDCFSILVQAHIPGLSYLHPLGHLPLWAARGALAGSSLHGSLQVSHGAEVTVDRAVQTRREHLPAAHLTKLETFPAGPGALAPTARLPPERFVHNYQRKRSSHSNDLFIKRFMFLRGIAPGLTFSANAEVMDRLWSGQSVTIHIVYFHAIVTNTCDKGPGDSWIVGRVNWFMQHILYTRGKKAQCTQSIKVLSKCIGFLYISAIPVLSWSCTYIEKKVQWKSKWPLVQMKSSSAGISVDQLILNWWLRC